MPFANGSELRAGFVPETSFGVTPANPAFQLLRTTGGGIDLNKGTGTSDEIRPDRNTAAEYLLGLDWQGAYNFELSYGSYDDLLAAVFQSSWANDVLKNGVDQKSFTIEETLTVGASHYYARFLGATPGKLDLQIAARRAVTGSVGIWARREVSDTAEVAGATYTAPTANPVLTASANVAALKVGAINPAPKVKSLSISIDNNMRTRELVGSLYSEDFGAGNCDVTGTIEAYFESNDLYNAVLAHGGGELSFIVGAAANQRYGVKLPNIVFGNGKKSSRAKNTDVMVSIPFRAQLDPASACSIQITRNVA